MEDFSVNSDKYHKQVKSLDPTDRSHASVFNERFQQLFDNTNFLHQGKAEKNGGDISEMIVESLETPDEKFPIPAAKESCKTFFGKSKKFFEDFKNWQAGVCLVGQIVNNCVTDRGDLPGSAAQLKILKDLYTQLNSDLTLYKNNVEGGYVFIGADLKPYTYADYYVPFSRHRTNSSKVVVGLYTDSVRFDYGDVSVGLLPGSITTDGFVVRLFNNTDGNRSPGFSWIVIP